MEGKKCRALGEDCQAVSEVVGQVLMIAIVVLAFSSIAVVIFSDVVVNPPHTPHTDLSEKIDTSADTVQIIHSGGEAIDLEAIKIVLIVDDIPDEFNVSDYNASDSNNYNRVKVRHSNGSPSYDNVLMLGDYITVYTNLETDTYRIDMKHNSTVKMYFVHMPSQQVIQSVTLQSENDRGVNNRKS